MTHLEQMMSDRTNPVGQNEGFLGPQVMPIPAAMCGVQFVTY